MRALPLVLAVLFVGAPLSAQQPAPDRTFGIGVSFNPGALGIPGEDDVILPQTGFNNLLFPIRTPNVTFEPEFGITRTSLERTSSGGTTTFRSKDVLQTLRYGLGVLKHFSRREGLEPYVGPRFGIMRFSSTDESSGGTSSTSSKVKMTNWYVGGAAGGQYFLSGKVSLGGEAQLRYMNIGSPKSETSGTPSPFGSKQSGSTIETIGLITLRWFF